MAARRKVQEILSEPEVVVEKTNAWMVEKKKVYLGVVVVLTVIGLWWYKTKTWPIAAVVNYQPITRYEINKSLFAQGGNQVAEGLITEILVKQELAKLGMVATEAEIDTKVKEIKDGLQEGQELEQLLGQSGMTMVQLRERIKTQLGVEKVATDAAKINDWLEGLKTKAKIWRFF
ncbi:MAG: PpiC-type peptidyl-prolyl cis-trans isomerase [Microgenomates group bacterium Gr01-1014_16]|nr:MAG: PpiC-type peptidyl-prolyl cis-trans isomerase [Microgenomates group bacterium Gr01-1014_16]